MTTKKTRTTKIPPTKFPATKTPAAKTPATRTAKKPAVNRRPPPSAVAARLEEKFDKLGAFEATSPEAFLKAALREAREEGLSARIETLRVLERVPSQTFERLSTADRATFEARLSLLGVRPSQWDAVKKVEAATARLATVEPLDTTIPVDLRSELNRAFEATSTTRVPMSAFRPMAARYGQAPDHVLRGNAYLPIPNVAFEQALKILNPERWPDCVRPVVKVTMDSPGAHDGAAWEDNGREVVNLVTSRLSGLDVTCDLHFKYESQDDEDTDERWARIRYDLLDPQRPGASGFFTRNDGQLTLFELDEGCVVTFTKNVELDDTYADVARIYQALDPGGMDRLTSAWLAWADGECG